MVGSGRDYRDQRSQPAALARALRGVWVRRSVRSWQAAAEPQTCAGEGGGAGATAVSGAVLRLQRAAFSREASRGPRHKAQLHMGEEGTAGSRLGGQTRA